MKRVSCSDCCPIPCSGSSPAASAKTRLPRRHRHNHHFRFDGPGLSCGKLNGKQEANLNWIKCTDMNKQPIYVNIENATSIFWIEKEKASIIGFPVERTA